MIVERIGVITSIKMAGETVAVTAVAVIALGVTAVVVSAVEVVLLMAIAMTVTTSV